MFPKNLSDPKHEFLIKKHEDTRIKHFTDSNAFIECSKNMDDVYENIKEYNLTKRRKILILFDEMIADIIIKKI